MEYVVNDRLEIPEEIMKMTREEIQAELARIEKEEVKLVSVRKDVSCGIKFII